MTKEKTKKPFYKKWWVWLIAVIVIGAIATGGDEDVAVESDASATEENDAEEVAAEETENDEESAEEALSDVEYGIGDKVELDGQVVEVTEVEKSDGNDFDQPAEGNEYVIVHVSIENNSDENISYNPFNFKMQNSNGQIEDQGLIIIDNDTSLSSGDLAPGGNVTGTLSFEQPKDDDGLKLLFEPGFWDTDQIIFDLS